MGHEHGTRSYGLAPVGVRFVPAFNVLSCILTRSETWGIPIYCFNYRYLSSVSFAKSLFVRHESRIYYFHKSLVSTHESSTRVAHVASPKVFLSVGDSGLCMARQVPEDETPYGIPKWIEGDPKQATELGAMNPDVPSSCPCMN